MYLVVCNLNYLYALYSLLFGLDTKLIIFLVFYLFDIDLYSCINQLNG